VQAAAEGKVIQMMSSNGTWNEYPELAFVAPPHVYRIKPEPKLRPWKPEEVPVGALIRWNNLGKEVNVGLRGFDVCFIGGIYGERIVPSVQRSSIGIRWDMECLLKYIEYSLDHGKTWLPCGVVED
jgi:hypothetical protein